MFRDTLFYCLGHWPLSDDWVRSAEVEVTSEFREGPPPSHAERSCQRVLQSHSVLTHALSRLPTNRNSTSLLLTRQTLAIERHRTMQEYKRDRSFSQHKHTLINWLLLIQPPPPPTLPPPLCPIVTPPPQSSTFSHNQPQCTDYSNELWQVKRREANTARVEEDRVTTWKEHSGKNN